MEIDFYQLLTDSPLMLVFVVLGLGLLVGHIKIGPTPLGSTIGVLLVGLVFGHFGLTIHEIVGTFGFALFIFSVGLQAGPSFFSAFRADGVSYVLLSLLVAISGVGLTILVAHFLDLPAGFGAGMLAGALTSTPSLAGAQDAFLSGLGNLGDLTAEQARQNVSIAYAITYMGGTAGVIALVRQLPRLLKIDLQEEARALAKERGLEPKRRSLKPAALPVIRAYEVAREDGRTPSPRLATSWDYQRCLSESSEAWNLSSPLPNFCLRKEMWFPSSPDLTYTGESRISWVKRFSIRYCWTMTSKPARSSCLASPQRGGH